MFYLNENEEKIIGTFVDVADNYTDKEMVLSWGGGNIVYAIYESYIEDENDCDMEDKNYEEFWSFVFKITGAIGDPPIFVTEDEFFTVNYHNFPLEIIADGKKIN